jgi:hypothetical protein
MHSRHPWAAISVLRIPSDQSCSPASPNAWHIAHAEGLRYTVSLDQAVTHFCRSSLYLRQEWPLLTGFFLAKSKSLNEDAVFHIDATGPQGAIRQWGI